VGFFFNLKKMQEEQEGLDTKDLQEALLALFSPADTFEEADEVMTPIELMRHLRKELGMDLNTPLITSAMTEAGFRREAIEARSYWLIKFA